MNRITLARNLLYGLFTSKLFPLLVNTKRFGAQHNAESIYDLRMKADEPSYLNIPRTDYVLLTGARDLQDNLIITFCDRIPPNNSTELYKALNFFTKQSNLSKENKFSLLIDRRINSWDSAIALFKLLQEFQELNPTVVFVQAYILRPSINPLKKWLQAPTPKLVSVNDESPIIKNHPQEFSDWISLSNVLVALAANTNFDSWMKFYTNIELLSSKIFETKFSMEETVLSLRQNNNISDQNSIYLSDKAVLFDSSLPRSLSNIAKIERFAHELKDSLELTYKDSEYKHERNFFEENLTRLMKKTELIKDNLECFWHFYSRQSKNARFLVNLNNRFNQIFPNLKVWESFVSTVEDYLPGHVCALKLESLKTLENEENKDPLKNLLIIREKLKDTFDFADSLIPDLKYLKHKVERLQNGRYPRGMFLMRQNIPGEEEKQISDEKHFEQDSGLNLDQDSDSDEESHLSTCNICQQNFGLQIVRTSLIDTSTKLTALKNMIRLAETVLQDSISRFDIAIEFYKEVFNAWNFIKQGKTLLNTLSGSEESDAQNLIPFQLPVDIDQDVDKLQEFYVKLQEFLHSHKSNIERLSDPLKFRTSYSQFSSSLLGRELQPLLSELQIVEENCRHAISCIQRAISRCQYPQPTASLSEFSISSISNLPLSGPSSNQPLMEILSNRFGQAYSMAWEELLNTERKHVKFLLNFHKAYWFKFAEHFKEDSSLLLANWPEQIEFHRDVSLPKLESSEGSPNKILEWANTCSNRMIDLYTFYCICHTRTIALASYLERHTIHSSWVSDCQAHLNNIENGPIDSSNNQPGRATPILPLNSRLITPVQRFQRYHLLLERMYKLCKPTQSEESNEIVNKENSQEVKTLMAAHKVMVEVCSRVNLATRFRGLTIPPSKLGQLMLQGSFSVTQEDSRFSRQRYVFLFDRYIILTKYRPPGSYVIEPWVANSSENNVLNPDIKNGSLNNLVSINDRRTSFQSEISSSMNNIGLPRNSFNGLRMSENGSATFEANKVYEVKQILFLSEIGLTTTYRDAQKKFAIWTKNRTQTFVFYHGDSEMRKKWVDQIGDVLMNQLFNMREAASIKRSLNTSTEDNESSQPISNPTVRMRPPMMHNGNRSQSTVGLSRLRFNSSWKSNISYDSAINCNTLSSSSPLCIASIEDSVSEGTNSQTWMPPLSTSPGKSSLSKSFHLLSKVSPTSIQSKSASIVNQFRNRPIHNNSIHVSFDFGKND